MTLRIVIIRADERLFVVALDGEWPPVATVTCTFWMPTAQPAVPASAWVIAARPPVVAPKIGKFPIAFYARGDPSWSRTGV